ncbi:hypothetical protein [Streptomyces sp. NPDC086777]|uniref:hypothetical protein n=1 Tax=Streptomyces sp. NPDC086777 TaxID=3154866 RepID=UPI003450A48C
MPTRAPAERSVKAVDHDFPDVHSSACGDTRPDRYTGNGFSCRPWTGTPGKPARASGDDRAGPTRRVVASSPA